MTLMNDDAMTEIGRLMRKYWRQYFEEAASLETIELYEAAKIVSLQTACEWTGIPLQKEETEERAGQISDLFESPALERQNLKIQSQPLGGRHCRRSQA